MTIIKKYILYLCALFIVFYENELYASDLKQVNICRSAGHPIHLKATPIIEEAYRMLGIEVVFKDFPSKRSLMIANEGNRCFGEVSRIKINPNDYPNLVQLNVPNLTNRAFIYSLDKANLKNDWDDLKGERFAYVRGELYAKTKGEKLGGNIAKDYPMLLKLLESGRVDYIVGLDAVLSSYPEFKKLYQSPYSVFEANTYHVLHRKNKHLVPQLDQAILKVTGNRSSTLISSHY